MAWNFEDWIKATNQLKAEGEKGLNQGIPYRIARLNKYVAGTQRGRYYLYFAAPGIGKSSIVYDQHIFVPYDHYIKTGIDLHIHMWSYEISPVFVIGKAMAYWLYTRKSILTDINHIFSIGEERLCPTIKRELESTECMEYITGLGKVLTIHTTGNRLQIEKTLLDFATTRGNILRHNNIIEGYVPNRRDEVVIAIYDHMSLVPRIQGESRKDTIDRLSEFNMLIRDKLRYTPIAIQQITPEKYDRAEDKVLPNHEDLRDSKNTYQDADVCISLGSPYKHGIATFIGYKIIPNVDNQFEGLEDRFRVIQVVKNRYGSVSIVIPTAYIGEVGMFRNTPDPEKVDYGKAMSIKKFVEKN